MYQDLVAAMENTSICTLEERLGNLIKHHEADFNSRNQTSDFPIRHSPEFREKLDAIINTFLEVLASGQLEPNRSRDIAHTLLSVRCYTAQ